jgi:hypothetical protein
MKQLVSLILSVSLWATHTAAAESVVPPDSDATAKWTYPYKADAGKEKRIQDGVERIIKEVLATPTKVLEVLGPPDQVTDLSNGGEALSSNEDTALQVDRRRLPMRRRLIHRMVWYIAKSGSGQSADDVWFAAYTDRAGTTVTRLMRNNLKVNVAHFPGE